MTQATQGLIARNLVAGEWVSSGDRRQILNPANLNEVVGEVVDATPQQAARAVDAAADAGRLWAKVPLADRCKMIAEAVAHVGARANTEDWAALLTREQGKILPESFIDIGFTGLLSEYCLSVADQVFAEERLTDGAGSRVRFRRPVGVVGAITPWNWPITLTALKLIPAVLCGNGIVLKPAPATPLTVTSFVDAFASALPTGLVNVVHGGSEVGTVLTTHPKVRKVAFTGSTRTGRQVMRDASLTVKNITLELGGNDPAIVLDDVVADDHLAEALLTAAFTTSGQVCMAIKRLYVHETRFDEIVDLLSAALDRLVVGDGLDPRSTMGPLNNRLQFDRVSALLGDAESRGASVRPLGSALDVGGWDNAYFIRPTLITEIADDAPVVSEEQFGPVLPVLRFRDEADVISRANNSEFGLCSSVWSPDEDRAFALGRYLESGATFINAHGLPALELSCPAGGVKQSGLGREFGVEGIQAYTENSYVTNRVQ
jgi:aldehyde dehydrogenase